MELVNMKIQKGYKVHIYKQRLVNNKQNTVRTNNITKNNIFKLLKYHTTLYSISYRQKITNYDISGYYLPHTVTNVYVNTTFSITYPHIRKKAPYFQHLFIYTYIKVFIKCIQ